MIALQVFVILAIVAMVAILIMGITKVVMSFSDKKDRPVDSEKARLIAEALRELDAEDEVKIPEPKNLTGKERWERREAELKDEMERAKERVGFWDPARNERVRKTRRMIEDHHWDLRMSRW